jgi:hypothetical protein
VHITLAASFPVLAATGLPPGLAAVPWAPGLAMRRDGPGGADVLRRSATLAAFGCFARRLRSVAFRMVLRRHNGSLRAPRATMPQPKSARDLAALLGRLRCRRWRQQFDRWTDRETFDYLAVFWGIAIIGLTGLVLWFPGAFTRALPDWARDTVRSPTATTRCSPQASSSRSTSATRTSGPGAFRWIGSC